MQQRYRHYCNTALLVLCCATLLDGCRTDAGATKAAGPPPAVQVVPVERRDVSVTSEWIATMDGYVNGQIQPHVTGYLVKQDYREGSVVRNGQLLFEIDPRPFQAALDQSKGQLAQAEAQVVQAQAQLAKSSQDVSRDTPLAEAKAIAQSELDDDLQAKAGAAAAVEAAQAAVTSAKAAVEQANLNLSFTKVTSLVDGVAGIAQAQIGDLVSTTTVLTSVSQVDPIKVYFPISEQDYLHWQDAGNAKAHGQSPFDGSPLTLVLSDGSVYAHTGKVLWTDRQIDTSTGTIRVAAAFPNAGNVLRPGQYGRVRAVTEMRHDALVVPQSALMELQGSFQVAIVGPDNKVTIQPVQIGSQVGAGRVVTQGVAVNDKVIVGGMQYASPGALVRPELAPTGGKLTVAKFFINRPIVAIVIAIITVLAGLVAMQRLPEAQFPDIVPPQIIVSTTYPGADAQTVEESVATPIEQQMNGVDNMLYMQSTNGNDNTMSLTVTFDVDTNVDTDEVNVQNRVAQAAPSLPPDVNQFGTTIRKQTGLPLLAFALYSPHHTHDSLFLANYANININDQILRVPGAGQVVLFGASDYSMRVWIRPQVLAKLGLTVNDLVAALNEQNTVNPAGQLGGNPAPPNVPMTYTLRTQGRLVTAEQFGQIVVRANPDGSVVRLQDVARIELGALSYNEVSRFNGQPSCIIAVFLTPGANAVAVADAAHKVMDQLKQRFPPDLDYSLALDTTSPVTEGIHEIVTTLVIAMILVILVVYMFLQNWRATLIPMIAVPVSLIGTFAFFPALGFSINTLSLFGLVLAIGLVVDDAIVVVEAVEHHIEEGMPVRDATLQAMREVSGPVVAIALILAAVFVPMAFMSGIQGSLNKQFAVTVAISVLISAFNALTLSPALSALLLRPRQAESGFLARFFGGFNRTFDRLRKTYVNVSQGLIRKAVVAMVLLGVFVILDGLVGRVLPTSFLPEEDYGFLFMNVQLPPAASLERTDVVTRKIEAILAKTPGVGAYTTIDGFSLLTRVSTTNNAFYFVTLKPWSERTASGLKSDAITADINRQLQAQVPEAIAFAFSPPAIPGLGNAAGFSLWVQDRSGSSVEDLDRNLQRFLLAASKRPELIGINAPFSAQTPQIFATVDRDKALKQGVELSDVYQTMQASFGGLYVNQFNRFGRQWKVFVEAEAEDRSSIASMDQYYVRNRGGTMVPLSTLVSSKPTNGPDYTNRFNLYRAAQVIGAPAPGYSSGQAQKALEEVAQQTLPSTMGYDWADLSYQENKASGTAAPIFGLSLLVVFLILAALYESWTLPFSVLLSVPIAIFGAFAGLYLRSFDLDVYAQIGLVMLIGLAAKNAILIVEFARDEMAKGRNVVDAALEGAKLRLRPILMTSFAFILGCVPLAIASGSGASGRQILGTVVVAGMLAATALGIFVIPVLFVLFERIALRLHEGVPSQPGIDSVAASHGAAEEAD